MRIYFAVMLFLLSDFLTISASRAETSNVPPHYRIINLGSRFIVSGPHCLNQSGIVAGSMQVPSKTSNPRRYYRTYIWKNGVLTDLRIAEHELPSSTPTAINNHGQVIGTIDVGEGEMNFHSFGHAFLWTRGRWQDLGILLSDAVSYAEAINDRGEVAIAAQTSTMLVADNPDIASQRPSYLYRKGQIMFLDYKEVIALNNKSQALLSSQGSYYLWGNGKTSAIGSVDGNPISAYDMNNEAQIIGQTQEGAFLYEKGHFILLDQALSSTAASLNNRGQIVGSFDLPQTKRTSVIQHHACLWQKRKRHDLNKLISAKSGWVLTNAVSINDQGEIVGSGSFRRKQCTFLMMPLR